MAGYQNRAPMKLNISRDELKKNPPRITGKLLKRILSYLLPYWPYLCLTLSLILLSALLDLQPSLLTGRIIDEGFLGGDFPLLLKLIGASFLVLVLSNAVSLAQSYLNVWIAQRISKDMRNQMYAHLQNMSHRFFTSGKQGDIITRMTSDISGVETVISNTLVSAISNIAVLFTSIVAMYQKNWLLATIGIIIAPLMVAPAKTVGRQRWKLTLESQKKNDVINQILNETLSVSGQQLVKLFTNEEVEREKYVAANESMFKLRVKENMAGRGFRTVMNTFTNLGPMLIYLVGGILILQRGDTGLTVGDITVMVSLLNRMYRPVNSLMEFHVDFVRAMALFSRIFDYLDLPIEIKNVENPIVPETIQGTLSFENVGFCYTRQNPVLKDVSFQVQPGQMVALVGPSGAGKSTIVNLISRLYDVTEGCVRVDGYDVRELDLTTLRRNVGVVTQDSYLFNGTIRENLLYAKADASEEELIDACKQANIHDFIAGLPAGYNTVVGNRGIKLSGGERQRIAIARVILKNPQLLILDEATSSLDSISESLIQDAIEPLLKERTSIVIAHRLSTVLSADQILVLEGGTVAERGTHQELLKNENGVYKKLYETQFKKDEEIRQQSCLNG